jgi:hypothetical protein
MDLVAPGPGIADDPKPPLLQDGSAGPVLRFTSDGWSWEWLVDVAAHGFEHYAHTAVSLFDSLDTDSHWQYFMVSAQTARSLAFYDSPVDSGYSVDNLSPSLPEGLAGEQSQTPVGLTIVWNANDEPDFHHYAVYRGSTEDFAPAPGNLIGSPLEASLFDDEWRWNSGYYYKISALDVHGNESTHALLQPEDITGADVPVTPLRTFLGQNYPNPFNPMTTICFGLDESAVLSLRVYDAAGCPVRVIAEGKRPAGTHSEVWDGCNDMGQKAASGVYFYRLETGMFTQTKKMILLR